MATIPKIVPISDLRLKVTSIVKDLAGSREPVYITQRGRASAALISLEAFQQAQQERDLLRFLAQGEKEMEAGKGSDLKEVVKEADRLLERMKA